MNRDNKIIGGMFGLPETLVPQVASDISQWKFLNDSSLFLANARSGMSVLIDRLKPINVWMPSYFCPSMTEAVDQSKANLQFYQTDYDLRIPSVNWIERVQSGDLVILIDYFGFPLDSNVATLAKNKAAWILEDACQALLSEHVGQYSDFTLFSPRKYIGVPDGGILVSCCDVTFDYVELEAPPASWWLQMLEATINRREFDQYSEKRRWYHLFQATKATMPCGYYAMSDLSHYLLRTRFDYSDIARVRAENYSVLVSKLKGIALFPTLSKGTVPVGCPVRHCRRDLIRERLFQGQIYPPVHWPLDQVTPEEFLGSCRLANHIMTLPCDQRYNIADMERMADIVAKHLR